MTKKLKKSFFLLIVCMVLTFSSAALADEGNSHEGKCDPAIPGCTPPPPGGFAAPVNPNDDNNSTSILESVISYLNELF